MEKIFQDIVGMGGVYGLVLLSAEGKVLFESLDDNRFQPEKIALSWKVIIESIVEFKEMDLVYEQGRYYMRKTDSGYILISMSLDTSIAMVKLNCDIVIPELKKHLEQGKGLKRFFKF